MIERIATILIVLTVHELAHGWVALLLGDETAKRSGRLTLNPLAHLDIFGALMLMFGPFGWAKPVPVDPSKFKKPKTDMAIVALAGPLSNIIFAFLIAMMFRLKLIDIQSSFVSFFYLLYIINIGIAFFNLIPIYPLDGSRILMAFLGNKEMYYYIKLMRYIPILFLLMITAEWLLKIPILSFFLSPIFNPIFNFAHNFLIG